MIFVAAVASAVLLAQVVFAIDIARTPAFLGAREAGVWLVLQAVLALGATVLCALLPRARLRVPIALAAAGAALAALGPVVNRRGPSLVFAMLTMAALWKVGGLVLRRLGEGPDRLADDPAIRVALGLGALGIAAIVLGRLELIRWWTLGVPVMAVGVLGVVDAARSGIERSRRSEPSRLAALAAVLLLGQVAWIFLWSSVPDVMFDAVYAKAWVPELWARTGEIRALLQHPALGSIGLADLPAVPGHLLGGHDVGRFFQLASGAVAVIALWRLADRRWPGAGPLVALAVGLTPHVVWQATTAFDDLILVVVAVACASAVIRLGADGIADHNPVRSSLLVGALAAICFDAKLHLAVFAIVIAIAWVVGAGSARHLHRRLGGVLAGGVVAGAAWPLMMWHDTGNPVFPTFNALFKSRYFPPVNETWAMPYTDDGSLGALLRLPWTVVGHPSRMMEAVSAGGLGVLAVMLLLALVIGWRGSRSQRIVWLALLGAFVTWWSQLRYLRYVLPYAAVSLLLVVPVRRARERSESRAGFVPLFAAGLAAAVFFPAAVATFWNIPGKVPMDIALRRKSGETALKAALPEVAVLRGFNAVAPRNAMAAAAGDVHARTYLRDDLDLTPDWELHLRIYGSCPGGSPGCGDDVDDVLRRYRAASVGWVLQNSAAQQAYMEPLLRRHGEIVFAAAGVTLYRLVDTPVAPRPVPLCDGDFRGLPGCWNATLDATPGFTAPEASAGTSQRVPVCTGSTYTLTVKSAGPGATRILLGFAPLLDFSAVDLHGDEEKSIRITAPKGQARIDIGVLPLAPNSAVSTAQLSANGPTCATEGNAPPS